MRINVKPLTHWIIYKGYTVRFTKRTPQEVTGILRTPENTEIPFAYEPQAMIVWLPQMRIVIDEHGWELEKDPDPDYNSKSSDSGSKTSQDNASKGDSSAEDNATKNGEGKE